MDINFCRHCHDGLNGYWDENNERYIEENCSMCRGIGYTTVNGFNDSIKPVPMSEDLKRAIERVLANVKAGRSPLS